MFESSRPGRRRVARRAPPRPAGPPPRRRAPSWVAAHLLRLVHGDRRGRPATSSCWASRSSGSASSSRRCATRWGWTIRADLVCLLAAQLRERAARAVHGLHGRPARGAADGVHRADRARVSGCCCSPSRARSWRSTSRASSWRSGKASARSLPFSAALMNWFTRQRGPRDGAWCRRATGRAASPRPSWPR